MIIYLYGLMYNWERKMIVFDFWVYDIDKDILVRVNMLWVMYMEMNEVVRVWKYYFRLYENFY